MSGDLRRNVRQGARTPIPGFIREAVYRRDKGCCRYCGISQGPFHLDHVRPWSWGGADLLSNLVLACVSCNLRKGASYWKPKPILGSSFADHSEEIQRWLRRYAWDRIAEERGHVIATSRYAGGFRWKCSCGGRSRGVYARKELSASYEAHYREVL